MWRCLGATFSWLSSFFPINFLVPLSYTVHRSLLQQVFCAIFFLFFPQKIRLELREKEDRIKALTNQKAVREQKFRNRFREEGKVGLDVRDWAARNGDKLKGQVVGPIGLEVSHGEGGRGYSCFATFVVDH